jgi:hypothetical protein
MVNETETRPEDEGKLAQFWKSIFKDTTPDATLSQSKYDFTNRVFPQDLASEGSHHRHYMVININVRDGMFKDSQVGATRFKDYIITPNGQVKTFSYAQGSDGGEMSKTDVLRYNLDPQYKDASGRGLGINANSPFTLPRFTRRIVESIALFMPQSVQFTNQHDYEDISLVTLGTEVAGGMAGYGGSMARGLNGLNASTIVGNIIEAPLQKGQNLAQLGQIPLNPMIEILYRTTPQRQFVFDFLLAPQNRAETLVLDQIYKTLRFHSAPEFDKYFLPLYTSPSEFDITFFHDGAENTAIPRINTCVLEKIDMDFSPTGVYATFSNGASVMARMTLFFRELEIVSKLRVAQGF